MKYAIGIVLALVGMGIASYIKVLASTKNVLGALIWLFLIWLCMITGSFDWFLLLLIGLIIMEIFGYVGNKRKEEAILNTVQYMITQENCKNISIKEVDEKLKIGNTDFTSKTLHIYKSKALVPYNIEITR